MTIDLTHHPPSSFMANSRSIEEIDSDSNYLEPKKQQMAKVSARLSDDPSTGGKKSPT